MRKAGGARKNCLPLYGLNSYQIPGANINDAHDACLWPSLQSEHILHRITARGPADEPRGGTERAAGEILPVARAVRDLDALALGGEQHAMFADDVAGTHDREADAAGRARTGLPVALEDRARAEARAARLRHGLTEAQGGARGRVALRAVMRFENLDVVSRPERPGRQSDEFGDDVDADAGIRSHQHRNAPRRLRDEPERRRIHAGRADHQRHAD